ncbi:MAG: hypothetical protein C0395_02230 [Gemmatimonas sp.]|nr:hypothetical protein [Gemmatimonas sp.]
MKQAILLACHLLVIAAAAAASDTVTIPPLQCGDDEREYGAGACPQETKFTAGTVSTALHLKVGGEAAGCDSEWATSLEFGLETVPAQQPVVSAVLVVRKTGYSDDSEGFPYVGVFAYPATGAPVSVGRDELTPDTMLDVVFPSSANVDLSFDVTAAVQALVDAGAARAGFLLAGVYSEVGYEDWISVGGMAYAVPPRLVVVYEGTVAAPAGSWSAVKAAYR